MPVLRHRKNVGFTQISNEVLERPDMSLKAKGLLAYLLSKPDGWEFTIGSVTKWCGSDGKDSVRSGLSELESLGYLTIGEEQRESGKYVGGDWTVSDRPHDGCGETVAGKPLRENRCGKPATAIYIVNNTERSNTEEVIPPIAPQNDAEIREIVAYLNETLGTDFKPTTKLTRSLINARLAEGYAVEDFKAVIAGRHAAWAGDPRMSEYLRPQTLFSTKFESYLNAERAATHRRGPASPIDASAYNRRGR